LLEAVNASLSLLQAQLSAAQVRETGLVDALARIQGELAQARAVGEAREVDARAAQARVQAATAEAASQVEGAAASIAALELALQRSDARAEDALGDAAKLRGELAAAVARAGEAGNAHELQLQQLHALLRDAEAAADGLREDITRERAQAVAVTGAADARAHALEKDFEQACRELEQVWSARRGGTHRLIILCMKKTPPFSLYLLLSVSLVNCPCFYSFDVVGFRRIVIFSSFLVSCRSASQVPLCAAD
jgi:hypothetical protein